MYSSAAIGWFEGETTFPTIPRWVKWFIEAGRTFPEIEDDAQRLLMISTPCDSPAAALVSLGVLLRDLARENATDVANHAGAVRSWARKNLGGKIFRYAERGRRTAFEVTSIGADGMLTLTELQNVGARRAGPRAALKLTRRAQSAGPEVMKFGPGQNPDNVLLQFVPDIEGWVPPKNLPNELGLSKESFSWIQPNWNPIEERLRESYSGACFAGRKLGRSGTRAFLQQFGFVVERSPDRVLRCGLDSMLTINGWGEDSVSRLRYCNMRGKHAGNFDDRGTALEMVVVDGADELIKALQIFQSKSLIAIMPRDVDSEKLEALSQSLDDRSFTRIDDCVQPSIEQPPPGVSIEWRNHE